MSPDHRALEQPRAGWVERLLMRLFRYRDIGRDGKLYLRRFYLTPRTWRWRFFLHHIVRPDSDPDKHDHPWAFRTLVLGNPYTEEVEAHCDCLGLDDDPHYGTTTVKTVRGFASRPARYRHKITKVGRNTWTLVLASQGEREWGFWVEGKWVPWYQYLNVPNDTAPEDRIR